MTVYTQKLYILKDGIDGTAETQGSQTIFPFLNKPFYAIGYIQTYHPRHNASSAPRP